MEFVSHDLGHQDAGNVVIVTLANQANVRLMDASNFQRFRSGGRANFYGGGAVASPVRLEVPHSGHWYVVLDLGGAAGTIRSSVQVLSAAA
jgi:hypothetical protein